MNDDDFMLSRGIDNRQTNEQIFVIIESLLRLKNLTKIQLKLLQVIQLVKSLKSDDHFTAD